MSASPVYTRIPACDSGLIRQGSPLWSTNPSLIEYRDKTWRDDQGS